MLNPSVMRMHSFQINLSQVHLPHDGDMFVGLLYFISIMLWMPFSTPFTPFATPHAKLNGNPLAVCLCPGCYLILSTFLASTLFINSKAFGLHLVCRLIFTLFECSNTLHEINHIRKLRRQCKCMMNIIFKTNRQQKTKLKKNCSQYKIVQRTTMMTNYYRMRYEIGNIKRTNICMRNEKLKFKWKKCSQITPIYR